MTRISQNQMARTLLVDINRNKNDYNKYAEELSSGLKVSNPGDSKFSATISQYRDTLDRIAGHQTRIAAVQGQLSYQESVMQQAAELLVRAKELAAQGVNETVGTAQRAQMSKEVFELRDSILKLANSTYQGKYIFGGAIDNTPPYNLDTANPYDGSPANNPASLRYTYWNTTTQPAAEYERTVNVTDEVSMAVNTPGNKLFDNAIQALDRLGRSLAGYRTTANPATDTPNGSAYNLPLEMAEQTKDIARAIDLLESARQNDIMPEEVTLGARQKRLETAAKMLELTKADAEKVLDGLQSADYATSATNLTQAENALQASYTVSTKILNMSVLDYI